VELLSVIANYLLCGVLLCELSQRLNRKQTIISLIVILLLIPVSIAIDPCRRLSGVDSPCQRPQDVPVLLPTYDTATDRLIASVPTGLRCQPSDNPEEQGMRYVRLQWHVYCHEDWP